MCLHCETALVAPRGARLARVLGRLVIAGGALVTLMACYGMTMRPGDRYARCGGDQDGDTVCADRDCDDTRADVFPGAADPDLDNVDQNCDGVDGWRDPATMAAPEAAPAEAAPPDAASPPIATDPP